MTNLILPRRKLFIPTFAAGLAAASPAMGHNGGPSLEPATEAQVSVAAEKAKGAGLLLPWGTLPSDPSLAMFMMAKMSGMLSGGNEAGLGIGAVFDIQLNTASGLDALSTTGWDLLIGKSRVNATDWVWRDSARGFSNKLASNTNAAQSSFTSYATHLSSGDAALYRFKQSANFYAAVTYTGNGSNRTIAHPLASVPGMIVVKRLDTVANCQVYYRSLAATEYLVLNGTNVRVTGSTRWNSTAPTSSVFSVGTDATVNSSGGTYVAYLFAHDTDPAGLIQCGSFTTDGSGNASINLGWRPQFLIIKCTSDASGWYLLDTARGWAAGSDLYLRLDDTSGDSSQQLGEPTGIGYDFQGLGSGRDFSYLATRAL